MTPRRARRSGSWGSKPHQPHPTSQASGKARLLGRAARGQASPDTLLRSGRANPRRSRLTWPRSGGGSGLRTPGVPARRPRATGRPLWRWLHWAAGNRRHQARFRDPGHRPVGGSSGKGPSSSSGAVDTARAGGAGSPAPGFPAARGPALPPLTPGRRPLAHFMARQVEARAPRAPPGCSAPGRSSPGGTAPEPPAHLRRPPTFPGTEPACGYSGDTGDPDLQSLPAVSTIGQKV